MWAPPPSARPSFDEKGQRVPGSLTQRKHAVSHSPEGAAELDPATLEAGLLSCLESTLSHAARRQIAEVGMSCFWHSLVGIDARGRVLTPIYTWADARCREDAARLRKEMREDDYHALTGCMLRASYWPAKLRWLARTQPGRWKKVARWQSPAEWLLGRLCARGSEICAHGMATGTGLYDPSRLAWDESLVKRCGLRRENLSAISEEALHLRPELRARFPRLADARWWPAIGDGAASNLGSGATQPGKVAINVGTSAALRVMQEGKIKKIPFGLFCYRVDTRRYVVGGAVSNAGNLRAWCRRELHLPGGDAALDRALSARPQPLSNLVVLPFWSAERAPTWCEDIEGMLSGLTQNTTALDLLQATTEAVFQRLALIADLSLPGTTGLDKAVTIIVAGGILKSTGLLQRLANVLGRTVHPSTDPEASLRGAAVYAWEQAGGKPGALGIIGRAVRPQAKTAALYARERARQVRLEQIFTAANKR